MSFLKSLFRFDTPSHLKRGDDLARAGEWGLAHMEYEKAQAALDGDSAALAGQVREKLHEAAEEILRRNLERAGHATEAGDLAEAVSYLEGAQDVLAREDSRRVEIEGRVGDLKHRLDEVSLREEIEAFLAGQGTAELVPRRRQWEFSMYGIHPADVDFDDSGNYTTLDLLETMAELDEAPDDPNRLANLGMALCQTGFTRRALAPLRRAAEIKPDDKQVHYLLGNALADLGHLDLAVASFDKAIELDPGFALAYLYLARTYLKAGDDDEAERLLRKALETGSDDSGVPEEARDLIAEIQERRVPESGTPDSLEDRIP